jgi:adenine C2-methylase RlmN of 23S rRNA A2503 and tRNA A37
VATGKSVLIEYVVIKDINDTPVMAHILGRLLTGMDVIVNLIPFNPTYVNKPCIKPLNMILIKNAFI